MECVRLTKLIVPSYHYVGDDAILSCYYDLEGEELYSVKWYKDGNEFFRFIPGERDQKVTVFSLPGVKVDVSFFELLTDHETLKLFHFIKITFDF